MLEANIQGMDMTFTIEKTVVYPGQGPHRPEDALRQHDQRRRPATRAGPTAPWATRISKATTWPSAKEELQTDMLGILRNLDGLDLPGPGAPRGRGQEVQPGLRHGRG